MIVFKIDGSSDMFNTQKAACELTFAMAATVLGKEKVRDVLSKYKDVIYTESEVYE